MEWISTDDKMPREDTWVLAYVPEYVIPRHKSVFIMAWLPDIDQWFVLYGGVFKGDRISHWMPLPDPPCNTPDDDIEQDVDTTGPVQADEQVAEPDQLSGECKHELRLSEGYRCWCADCGKPLAG